MTPNSNPDSRRSSNTAIETMRLGNTFVNRVYYASSPVDYICTNHMLIFFVCSIQIYLMACFPLLGNARLAELFAS